jgi:hypothetical protein
MQGFIAEWEPKLGVKIVCSKVCVLVMGCMLQEQVLRNGNLQPVFQSASLTYRSPSYDLSSMHTVCGPQAAAPSKQ